MSRGEITRREIVVMGNKRSPVFYVAIVALNQKHRQAGEIEEWIGEPLPLELANELAISEGAKRGLPVIVWAEAASDEPH